MRRCMLVAALMVALPVCGAEKTEADPIRRALKDIPPAGLTCSLPEAGPAVSGASKKRQAEPVDLGCAIDPERAAQLLAQPQTVLVDTRRKAAFDDYRIDGALNMPARDVKTLPHLKSRSVLLLGSGQGDRELYAACASLKNEGFLKVHVLRGGIHAWVRADRPIIGQPPSAVDMASLTPAALRQEASFEPNLVLRTPDVDPVKHGLPPATVVKELSTAAVKAAVTTAKTKRKGARLGAVVLVLGEKVDRSGLEALLAASGPDPVLVYGEPLSAYAQYLDDQKAMWVAQAQGPRPAACTP